jgi:ABC-type bacteriocin/lantibiotic exporter with double-glycine peptidase domain
VRPSILIAIVFRMLIRTSGLSGSGKSSVHALLLRYYDPVKGVMRYDGQGDSLEITNER